MSGPLLCSGRRSRVPPVAHKVLAAQPAGGGAARARVAAQPAAVTEAPQPPLHPRVGVTGEPSPLRLEDAVRLALQENNDVAIARLDVQASREDIRAALGVFDPRFLPTFGIVTPRRPWRRRSAALPTARSTRSASTAACCSTG